MILSEVIGPSIKPAIKAAPGHAPCPVYADTKDSFHLYNDWKQTGGGFSNREARGFADGFALISWALDISDVEALNKVAEVLRWQPNLQTQSVTPRRIEPDKPAEPDQKILNKMAEIWGKSRPLTDVQCSLAWQYYLNRGLQLHDVPNNLRFTHSHPFWERDGNGKMQRLGNFPAIIARVTDAGGHGVNIHRTYLDPATGNKANVPDAKKLMKAAMPGMSKGCAVHLYPAGEVLAVTEGIETALAVRILTGLPVWATVNAANMQELKLPPTVRSLLIFADLDRNGAGERAGNELGQRFRSEGKQAHLLTPPMSIPDDAKGVDWLDYLNQADLQNGDVLYWMSRITQAA
jgi:phage/plasmid primase-like uncharacterized protein